MSTVQLNFTIRTSSRCRSVHLIGSWDGYKTSLPLSRDSSRDAGWKGTFRFTAPTLQPGGRYWYYYMTDGLHISHDPARPSVLEPTTGRKLNILDIPAARYVPPIQTTHHRRHSGVKGRSLSPSRIIHPAPSRPYETRLFRGDHFSGREMEALSARYAAQRLSDSSSGCSSDSDSPASYSSRSSHNSSPSSVSSLASPITPISASPTLPAGKFTVSGPIGLGISGLSGECSCERYALLRDGRKVRVDCGGRVCGASSGSDDSSGDESSDAHHHHHSRHHHHKSSTGHSRSSKSKTSSKSSSSSKAKKRHGFLGWR